MAMRGAFLAKKGPPPPQRNLKKGNGGGREVGCGCRFMGRPTPKEILKKGWRRPGSGVRLPLHGSPHPQRNLKKGMAAAGKWGAVGRFMGRPAPKEILKKGMVAAGGLSSLARPRKWAAAGWPVAEVGGQTGKFAHRREVRQSRIFSPRSATFAALPLSRRAVSWSLRRFRAAPFHGRPAAVRGCGCRRLPLSRRA